MNLDKLWTLVSEEARKASTEKKAAVIDVTKAVSSVVVFFLLNNKLGLLLQGFFKVCGKGELPAKPCIVRAKMFSKIAEKRIREAGGVCQLIA